MANRLVAPSVVALLAWMPAPTPSAQTTSGSQARAGSGAIEEIIVTARKREESLQDTTISLQAFTDEDLSARAVRDLIDIGEQTPNLLFDISTSQYNPRIYIRGVGSDDLLPTVDPGVGVYVDGVYIARTNGLNLDVTDIERVEVLRGPQGTLYGRNTIGGAINLIPKKPTGEFDMLFKVEGGLHNTLNTDMAMNFPIMGETLSGRLSLGQDYSAGWYDNEFGSDTEWNNNKGFNGRLALRFVPSETVEWGLTLERVTKDAHPAAVELNTVNESANGFSGAHTFLGLASAIDNDPHEGMIDAGANSFYAGSGQAADRGENSLDVSSATLIGEYDVNDALTFKTVTAYRELETRVALDIDGTQFGFIDVFSHDNNNQLTQEFQLNGSWLDDSLDMVSGIYWFYENSKNEVDTYNSSGTADYRPVVGAATSAFLSSDARTDQRSISYAGYTNFSYEFAEGLTLDLGLRYTYDQKQFRRLVVRKTGATALSLRQSNHWDNWSPMAGLQYQLTDDMQVYAKWSRGFRSGGFNGRAASNATTQQIFDPETVKVTEVGMKSSWWDNKANFNIALFRNNFTNQQLTSFTSDTTQFVSLVQNAGSSRILGCEADLYLRPMNGLDITASIGVTKAKYHTFREPLFTTPTTFTLVDVAGRHFKNAPTLTGNVGVTYTFEAAGGWMTLNTNYSYRGKVYYNTGVAGTNYNRDSIAQGQIGLINARAAWANADDTIEVALYGKNLTNREWDVFGLDFTPSLGFTTTYPAPPLEAGIELTYRFN